MKWNIRIKTLFAVCLACFCCSALCCSAFAYNYDYSFERDLNASVIYSVNGDYFQLNKNGDGGVFREGMNWYGDSPLRFDQTSHIHLNINGSLPAYSLVKIDIFFSEYRNQDYQFRPFCPSSRDGSYTVVDCSYGEYGVVSAIIYIDDEVSVLDLYNNMYYSISGATYTMRVSNASGVKLASPLTANDLTTLKNSINNNIDEFAQAVDNDFTTIINLLRDKSVQESIADNTERSADIAEEQHQQEQADREQFGNVTDDASGSGDSISGEVEGTGQSLLTTFTQFLAVLHSVHTVSNCKLPNMSYQGMNLNNIDLCELNPPTEIMTLASVGLVFILVPLSLSLVRRLIGLYKMVFGD